VHVSSGGDQARTTENIIGQSDLKYVLSKIEQVALTDATVLIRRDRTGAVARSIHSASPRKNRPLVKVDRGLPSNLIESGSSATRAAFTSPRRRVGRFELAHGGPSDEVAEPLALQSKLPGSSRREN
jgi:transcriptional regulator with GAF, ATPase, and Fis domain